VVERGDQGVGGVGRGIARVVLLLLICLPYGLHLQSLVMVGGVSPQFPSVSPTHSSPSEVDEAVLDIGAHQLGMQAVSDIEALLTLD
jgi:hypothetical protein